MTRPLEDWLPYVLPYTPSCADTTAEQHIRNAAITFCSRTRCWREVDRFPTDGHPIEVLCVPPFANLFEIERAWFNGEMLDPVQFVDADGRDGGSPREITQVGRDSIRLVPRGQGDFRVSMILTPAPDTPLLPEMLFQHFGQDIAAGALASLLLIPQQPWTNPQLAMVKAAEFAAALDRNFAANIRGQHRAPARSRPSFF